MSTEPARVGHAAAGNYQSHGATLPTHWPLADGLDPRAGGPRVQSVCWRAGYAFFRAGTLPGRRDARMPREAVRTSTIAMAMKISPSTMAASVTLFAMLQLTIWAVNQCAEP